MKVLKISKDEIKDYKKLKIISLMALVKEKIALFEKKYGGFFKNFDKKVKKSEHENFKQWDNYIEWKSYVECLQDLEKIFKEIDDAENITIT